MISISLQTSSAAKNNKRSSQVNSLTAAGIAEEPNSTCFPHLNLLNQTSAKNQTYLSCSSFTEPVKVPNTHRIPFGVHLLLLKLGELSSVVDDHQQLPDEQQG